MTEPHGVMGVEGNLHFVLIDPVFTVDAAARLQATHDVQIKQSPYHDYRNFQDRD